MPPELTAHARGEILLHERATRQALVDRLAADSPWNRIVSGALVSIVGSLLYLWIASVLAHDGSRWLASLAAGAVTGLIWNIVWLVQVTRQLQAVTAILQRSGALSEFVEGPPN